MLDGASDEPSDQLSDEPSDDDTLGRPHSTPAPHLTENSEAKQELDGLLRELGRPITLVAATIDNYQIMNELPGAEKVPALLSEIEKFLIDAMKGAAVIKGEHFVVVASEIEDEDTQINDAPTDVSEGAETEDQQGDSKTELYRSTSSLDLVEDALEKCRQAAAKKRYELADEKLRITMSSAVVRIEREDVAAKDVLIAVDQALARRTDRDVDRLEMLEIV